MQAMAEAEDRFKSDDLPGAIRLAHRARDLCPSLHHPSNLLVALRIHCTAARHQSAKQRSAAFWHAILGSKPTDTVDALKRHYRRLSIQVHPDKNPSASADGAFKLVAQAWEILSANAASTKNDAAAAAAKSKAGSARWKWKASSPEKKADGGSTASTPQAPRGPWYDREPEKAGSNPKKEARKRAAASTQDHGIWYNCGGGTKIFVSSSSSSSSSSRTRVRFYVDANGERRISIC